MRALDDADEARIEAARIAHAGLARDARSRQYRRLTRGVDRAARTLARLARSIQDLDSSLRRALEQELEGEEWKRGME